MSEEGDERRGAYCISCDKPIAKYSEAHCLNVETASHAADERFIHCKCNGCKKNEFGDYVCIKRG